MRSVVHRVALLIVCLLAASVGAPSQSSALTFTISGGVPLLSESGQFAGYGTAVTQDNVVNSGTSGGAVIDTQSQLGSSLIASSSSSPSILQVLGASSYTIGWFYLGSESNDTIRLTAGSNVFDEYNANNNCGTCALSISIPSPQVGAVFVGLSSGTAPNVDFGLTDLNTGHSLQNGAVNPSPTSGGSNLIFSYANFDPVTGIYSLTTTPSSSVVFEFNDNGGLDSDHDDFVGAVQILGGSGCGLCELASPTPIGGTLPLFLGGVATIGALWRRRRHTRCRQ
jgi:hypothetical protein